ncbi:unnamed protein product [Trypanosoma congolense IL3000]|uniref:WGS project CAEQ00000000 data, annotated contig 239 n=1 Tax=Trypanosoma congolense (strain IL3000) TaxID=1068625 RepID=F9WDQ9_TRYCI|nr:unnamed protein product [Trypanosoma congolense IL3000]
MPERSFCIAWFHVVSRCYAYFFSGTLPCIAVGVHLPGVWSGIILIVFFRTAHPPRQKVWLDVHSPNPRMFDRAHCESLHAPRRRQQQSWEVPGFVIIGYRCIFTISVGHSKAGRPYALSPCEARAGDVRWRHSLLRSIVRKPRRNWQKNRLRKTKG